jgi:hypothetical protein
MESPGGLFAGMLFNERFFPSIFLRCVSRRREEAGRMMRFWAMFKPGDLKKSRMVLTLEPTSIR